MQCSADVTRLYKVKVVVRQPGLVAVPQCSQVLLPIVPSEAPAGAQPIDKVLCVTKPLTGEVTGEGVSNSVHHMRCVLVQNLTTLVHHHPCYLHPHSRPPRQRLQCAAALLLQCQPPASPPAELLRPAPTGEPR